jgi:hypothetical protein
VFSDRVPDIEILEGRSLDNSGSRIIRFALPDSYCGGHGNPSCYREHRITATPFAFKTPE